MTFSYDQWIGLGPTGVHDFLIAFVVSVVCIVLTLCILVHWKDNPMAGLLFFASIVVTFVTVFVFLVSVPIALNTKHLSDIDRPAAVAGIKAVVPDVKDVVFQDEYGSAVSSEPVTITFQNGRKLDCSFQPNSFAKIRSNYRNVRSRYHVTAALECHKTTSVPISATGK